MLDAQTKMSIYSYPSGTMKLFELNVLISERHGNFHRFLSATDRIYLREFGADCAAIVEKILEIPGVVMVMVAPYKIHVEISGLFDWDIIEIQIAEAIAMTVGGLQILRKWKQRHLAYRGVFFYLYKTIGPRR